MNLSLDNVWLAILLMGAATYLARSLPFWLAGNNAIVNRLAQPDSPLASLGPCLLMAMMAATVVPMLVADLQAGPARLVPTLTGLTGTLLVMKFWQNVGLAVVVGMVAYTLGLVALG